MINKITKRSLVLMLSGFTDNAQQSKEDVNLVTKDYDKEAIAKLAAELSASYKEGYEKAVKIAREKGLPIEGVDAEGNMFSLVGLIDGINNIKYYKSYNNTATKSSIQTARVQHLHNGGSLGLNIEGQTMLIGEWDGGTVYAGHDALGTSRVTVKDGSSTIGAHASHVAGTMIANGAGTLNDIKGMAP